MSRVDDENDDDGGGGRVGVGSNLRTIYNCARRQLRPTANCMRLANWNEGRKTIQSKLLLKLKKGAKKNVCMFCM